jgi:class 3 adenylate cyclase/tetratricopeptide (TPR) repeat protein
MPEERKLVTVLFIDIVGSTSMGEANDPEVVRAVLTRYFEQMRTIAEAHGGSVEKFIGDAVMAVFGAPRLHDDDAERAVRAALAMRDGMEALNAELAVHVEARIGVNTGEAVAAVGHGEQTLVTGDVVNVAARLEQAANADEILVGPLTEQLTREAIEYAAREPLAVRGKTEPVTTFSALRARTAVPEQARGLPGMRARLVGREREMHLLLETFERALKDRRAQLFTIVGTAGVGKSRLVGEFLARVASQGEVVVRRGRCLPYGTGIVYWPLMEILQDDLGVRLTDGRERGLEQLSARLEVLLPSEEERSAVESRAAVILGLEEAGDALPDVSAARLPAELGWGMRRYLEALAGASQTIVLVDDLQWADQVVVDVLAGIAERSLDVPLMIVTVARPDLLEHQPGWGAGRTNAAVIGLEPLNDSETRTLLGRLLDVEELPDDLRSKIVERSEGNPLFCEEFLRMLIDDGRLVREGNHWRALPGTTEVRVPESIQALLAARLDGLEPDVKQLVLAASVVGERFELDQLRALGDVQDAEGTIHRFERTGLIVEDHERGRRDAYRFRHLLIRDVAYSSLPKRERADAHEAFAGHLAGTAVDRHELTEILAHHADRALELSLELRLSGELLARRGRLALEWSLAAAERAINRQDRPAAGTFLATAALASETLGPGVEASDSAHLALLQARLEGLRGDYRSARAGLADATRLAGEAQRPDLAAAAQHALAGVLVFSAGGPSDDQELEDAVSRAIELYEEIGDVGGRLSAEVLALERLFAAGELTEMIKRGRGLAETALSIGEGGRAAAILTRLASAAEWQGKPALAESLLEQGEALAVQNGLRSTVLLARFYRQRLHWMRGEFDAAESGTRSVVSEAIEEGDGTLALASLRLLGETLMEEGRFADADVPLGKALDASEASGDRWSRTELLSFRAGCAAELGDFVAADRLLSEARGTLRQSDLAGRAVFDTAVGTVRRLQGRPDEAEAAFRRAVDLIRSTDYWWWAANAVLLADLLLDVGRREEARALFIDLEQIFTGTGYGLRWHQRERLRRELLSRTAAPRGSTGRRRAATKT